MPWQLEGLLRDSSQSQGMRTQGAGSRPFAPVLSGISNRLESPPAPSWPGTHKLRCGRCSSQSCPQGGPGSLQCGLPTS